MKTLITTLLGIAAVMFLSIWGLSGLVQAVNPADIPQ